MANEQGSQSWKGLWPWAAESLGAFLKHRERKEQKGKPGTRGENERASGKPVLRNLEDDSVEGSSMSFLQEVTLRIYFQVGRSMLM